MYELDHKPFSQPQNQLVFSLASPSHQTSSDHLSMVKRFIILFFQLHIHNTAEPIANPKI